VSGGATAARWSTRSRDSSESAAIGEALGRLAPDGALILLEGPLGAGKTTLAQGIGVGCGVAEPITSPTYNLILHYRGERPFTHVDLFRLEDESSCEPDLDSCCGDGVTCVEWPALGERHVEPPLARVRITPEDGPEAPRRIEIELAGEGWGGARSALVGLEAGRV
jgi:tRNA threonylcarbamoyladenosine biosynthesis protein TsaE